MKTPIPVRTFLAFHYDVAYRKTFEGYLEMSLKIIDDGLCMLRKHCDFVFVVEQVILMREYLARNPSMQTAARQFAQEGRLVFAPGMFTMPDVNIPSGESFIRNYRMGRDWLVEHLGIEPRICWMADIFGHHAQIPQLAGLCGYTSYLFERGKNRGDDVLFWWEGIDGSRLLTHWEIDTYFGLGMSMLPWHLSKDLDWVVNYAEKMFLDPLLQNSAVKGPLLSPIGGDFREPKEADLEFVSAFNRISRKYRIAMASPEKHFDEIRQKHGRRLPVLKTDFNPLCQGTYSSRISLKQANRRLEHLAASIEILESREPSHAPRASRQLWETLAWNAFHDIICGSLEDSALREALQDYSRAERETRSSLTKLILNHPSSTSPTNGIGTNLVVSLYNSLPYPREELIEIPLGPRAPGCMSADIRDSEGKLVEHQILITEGTAQAGAMDAVGKEIQTGKDNQTTGDTAGRSLLARLSLPAASITSFTVALRKDRRKTLPSRDLSVKEKVLENRFLRATFDRNGTIVSLIDKENRTELADPDRSEITVKGMNNIFKQPDMGDMWVPYTAPINGCLLYTAELRDPMADSGAELQRGGAVGFGSADADAMWWPTMRIVEKGPLRAAMEVCYREPNVISRISLARDEKLLRFTTRFMPSGKRYRLRVAFPTSIRKGKIRTSIPCGFVRRREGEYPAQEWMDYSDGKKGLCLLNRGLPGNNVTDDALILSLFRGVAMEDAGGQAWFEEGVEQVFEYALRPFGLKDRDYHPARLGTLFNRPVYTAFPDANQSVPGMTSIFGLNSPHVELMAYRRDADGIEIRFHEAEGKRGEVTLTLAEPVSSAIKTDLRGNLMANGGLRIAGRQVKLKIRPFEIVTLRVK